VLFYGKQTLATEIKTIRGKANRFNLQEDLGKLYRFPGEVANDVDKRRVSSWQLVAWTSQTFSEITSVQQGRNRGLDLLEKEIGRLSGAHNFKISNALVTTVPRIAKLGQLMLTEGRVDNFQVLCVAICIVPPSS
jgi:hypothetical protein